MLLIHHIVRLFNILLQFCIAFWLIKSFKLNWLQQISCKQGKKEQQMNKKLANKKKNEAKEIENLKSEIHEKEGDDYDE